MTTYKQKFKDLMESTETAVRARFMEDGTLPLTEWLIEDKHDIRILIAFAPDIPKDAMLEQMRKIVRDKEIVRYSVGIEAWMAVPDGSDLRPSERPDRMECLIIAGQDRQNNSSCVSIEIERKEGKHFLGDKIASTGGFTAGNYRLFEDAEDSPPTD